MFQIGQFKLLENTRTIIVVENKDSLADLIEENQYGPLVSNKEPSGLQMIKNNIKESLDGFFTILWRIRKTYIKTGKQNRF